MSQLPADFLEEIIEYLEGDDATLSSCLLVNHLWCGISVKILWRNIRNYNTLIACLPNDSKEILSKNGIITTTLASRPPIRGLHWPTFLNPARPGPKSMNINAGPARPGLKNVKPGPARTRPGFLYK